MTDTPGTLEDGAKAITETRHLATVNLWRNPDNSLSYTFAEASGVAAELGDSGAPVYLCAVNALRAAVSPEAADEIASLRARVEVMADASKLVFEAWDAHVTGNDRTNAAIPAIDATRAEREVYDERYRASEEAKREWYRAMHRFIETPGLRQALDTPNTFDISRQEARMAAVGLKDSDNEE